MPEKRLLYFALGVLSMASIGAVTNQVAPATSNGLTLSDTGIIFPDGTLQTTAARADPRRAFYVTVSTHNGANADGTDGDGADVCASGFHFASLWEIHDPSSLRYATDAEAELNARRTDDSGHGPPSNQPGWVRTGFASTTTVTEEGRSNCAAWTTSALSAEGTLVELEHVWSAATGTGDPSEMIAPWNSSTAACVGSWPVWCVEDYPGAGG